MAGGSVATCAHVTVKAESLRAGLMKVAALAIFH
jgi:hypothetical protein